MYSQGNLSPSASSSARPLASSPQRCGARACVRRLCATRCERGACARGGGGARRLGRRGGEPPAARGSCLPASTVCRSVGRAPFGGTHARKRPGPACWLNQVWGLPSQTALGGLARAWLACARAGGQRPGLPGPRRGGKARARRPGARTAGCHGCLISADSAAPAPALPAVPEVRRAPARAPWRGSARPGPRGVAAARLGRLSSSHVGMWLGHPLARPRSRSALSAAREGCIGSARMRVVRSARRPTHHLSSNPPARRRLPPPARMRLPPKQRALTPAAG